MTDYENQLISKLNEARPENKSSSHKQYVRCLRLLSKKNKEDSFNNVDFAKDTDLVFNLTSDLSDSTRRNYLTACANILRLEEKNEGIEAIIKYYEDKVKEYNNKYIEEQKTGKISSKQKPIFDIGMSGLLDMLYNMEKNLKDPTTYLAYTIYSILLNHPLRNEVGTLEKIKLKDFNKLKIAPVPDENDENKNYLVIPSNVYKKPLVIVSTNYKTDKKYGMKKVEIVNPQLRRKLLNYIKDTGNEMSGPLFTYNNNPVNEKTLTDILLYQSKKYTNEKVSVGTTMFAKITLSHDFNEINELMKKKAVERGHSSGIQSLTYIKQS
jgi:hypothetical protein